MLCALMSVYFVLYWHHSIRFIFALFYWFVDFLPKLMLPIFPLQLLSKQIGISGHIHRLMAGSMAGTDNTWSVTVGCHALL